MDNPTIVINTLPLTIPNFNIEGISTETKIIDDAIPTVNIVLKSIISYDLLEKVNTSLSFDIL